MKRCSRCGETKPLEEGFHRHRNRRDGHSGICKECACAASREYGQRPESRQRNRERSRARYHALPPEEKSRLVQERRVAGYHLRVRYDISVEQFEEMKVQQGALCAVCKKPPTTGRWVVDHDHACCPGKKSCGDCVRGLLCTRCNVRLGIVEDADWTGMANAYLKGQNR